MMESRANIYCELGSGHLCGTNLVLSKQKSKKSSIDFEQKSVYSLEIIAVTIELAYLFDVLKIQETHMYINLIYSCIIFKMGNFNVNVKPLKIIILKSISFERYRSIFLIQ